MKTHISAFNNLLFSGIFLRHVNSCLLTENIQTKASLSKRKRAYIEERPAFLPDKPQIELEK